MLLSTLPDLSLLPFNTIFFLLLFCAFVAFGQWRQTKDVAILWYIGYLLGTVSIRAAILDYRRPGAKFRHPTWPPVTIGIPVELRSFRLLFFIHWLANRHQFQRTPVVPGAERYLPCICLYDRPSSVASDLYRKWICRQGASSISSDFISYDGLGCHTPAAQCAPFLSKISLDRYHSTGTWLFVRACHPAARRATWSRSWCDLLFPNALGQRNLPVSPQSWRCFGCPVLFVGIDASATGVAALRLRRWKL